MLKRTPLYSKHLALRAKMVPFAGWEMPVSYPAGIIAEHKAVRTSCGVFDIGHMGVLQTKDQGPKTKEILNLITTNDVGKLSDFTSQYSIVCNEKGGVVDDILVYKLPDCFFIVCNAVNTDKLLDWIFKYNNGSEIELVRDISLIAVQGPQADVKLKNLFGSFPEIKRNHCVYSGNILTSRTGYTGEDGFELFVPKEKIEDIWDKLIEMKIQPCGLGARDTLRLEAGLPLFGHEYDEKTTPLEAGYGWAVKFNKGDFIGRGRLLAAKEEGVKRKLAGIVLSGRAVAREAFKIYDGGGLEVGIVTSGSYSPTLEKPIALAYIINKEYSGATVNIAIRGQQVEGKLVPLPFYKHS